MEIKEKGHNAPADDDMAKVLNSNELANKNDDYLTGIEHELSSAMEVVPDRHFIDLSKDYPEPRYSLSVNGIGVMPRGDISGVKAKSKNGKTFLCSIFCAAALGNVDFGFHTLLGDDSVVAFFDTEQNMSNTAKVIRRIHSLCGWELGKSNPRLIGVNLRTIDIAERFPYIHKVIIDYQPSLVVIDGVADLIQDFNDISQSSEIINKMMKLSAECDLTLVCVLHTNKAKGDNQMKGHLGTMLLQKASDVWEVQKKEFTFNVSQSDTRNRPCEDFSFQIDGHGIPYPAMSAKETKEVQKKDELLDLINNAFGDERSLSYTTLTEKIATIGNCSGRTAARKIKNAVIKGLINGDGKCYTLKL